MSQCRSAENADDCRRQVTPTLVCAVAFKGLQLSTAGKPAVCCRHQTHIAPRSRALFLASSTLGATLYGASNAAAAAVVASADEENERERKKKCVGKCAQQTISASGSVDCPLLVLPVLRF